MASSSSSSFSSSSSSSSSSSLRITNLPLEVIELITFYLAILSPFRPPTTLLNFLLLNKQIYRLLGPHRNAQLYAKIFRFLFDVKALERRLPSIPSSHQSQPSINNCPTLSSRPNPIDSTGAQLDHGPDHHPQSSNTTPTRSPHRPSGTRITHPLALEDPLYDPTYSHDPQALVIATSHRSKLDLDPLNTHWDQNEDHDTGGAGSQAGHPDIDHHSNLPSPQLKRTLTQTSTVPPILEAGSHEELERHVHELHNHQLASAYFERLMLFKRMRAFSLHPRPTHPNSKRAMDLEPYVGRPPTPQPGNRLMESISRDLWLIYFMVLENDGQNWIQLIQAAKVAGFLLNYFHYEIDPLATAPGYPIERPEIVIALKLCHLFLDLEDSNTSIKDYWTSEEGIETYLFVLKPYTIGSHQYDVAYAPWSIRELPIDLSSEQVLKALSHKLTLREKKTLSPIIWDPSVDHLQNPWIHDRNAQVPDPLSATPSTRTNTNEPDISSFLPSRKYCELAYMGKLIKILPPLHSHVAMLSFFWSNIRHTGPPGMQAVMTDDQRNFFLGKMKNMIRLTSSAYDQEFTRLISCLDPFESKGLRFDYYQNCFEGAWDGQFGFFDLSSFRQMLFGRMESIYQGRYGDQNQVFKVREFIVRVRDRQPVRFIEGTRERADDDDEDEDDEDEDRDRLSIEEPMENEIEHLSEMKYLLDPSYTEEESILVSYDPNERYELQIHGDGHSAWGHFKVKGRVRAWDGMLTFLKFYDYGRHGRWLYRGYHAPGDMMVGRWRDTMSSVAVDGYEGTFVMFKRN